MGTSNRSKDAEAANPALFVSTCRAVKESSTSNWRTSLSQRCGRLIQVQFPSRNKESELRLLPFLFNGIPTIPSIILLLLWSVLRSPSNYSSSVVTVLYLVLVLHVLLRCVIMRVSAVGAGRKKKARFLSRKKPNGASLNVSHHQQVRHLQYFRELVSVFNSEILIREMEYL
jgi:hypothetical protein